MARTATIQKKVLTFDELSEKVKEKLLDKYRHANTEFDGWWDPIFEGAREDLKKMGFDGIDIRFSGFYSQGDGASFTATSIDLHKWITHFKRGREYRCLLKLAKEGELTGKVVRDKWHNYVHWNTISVYLDSGNTDMDSYNTAKFDQLEKEIQEQVQNYSKEIYNRLDKYNDELTSDAEVTEYIKANIDEFEEDGTKYTETKLEVTNKG